ncbi:hypothetical protein A4A49_47390 [Nicotiana attenuata]|uniref:Uncharacterized protein n=1 Tax=Nicotiana attenuata TaxID=49451 RepID=A0A1J6IWU1_NICAT|nr:hypothetical protein A4A49_47390 [Nicotiana attenuata]
MSVMQRDHLTYHLPIKKMKELMLFVHSNFLHKASYLWYSRSIIQSSQKSLLHFYTTKSLVGASMSSHPLRKAQSSEAEKNHWLAATALV